jgi:hypothetical protein
MCAHVCPLLCVLCASPCPCVSSVCLVCRRCHFAGTLDLGDFFLEQSVDDAAPLRIRLPSKSSDLEYLLEADSNLAFVEWAKAIDGGLSACCVLARLGRRRVTFSPLLLSFHSIRFARAQGIPSSDRVGRGKEGRVGEALVEWG